MGKAGTGHSTARLPSSSFRIPPPTCTSSRHFRYYGPSPMDDRNIRETWGPRMRRDWDERAHADAFYYSTWKVGHKWDPDEFFESGERDCQLFVDPIIKELGLEPVDSAMLELGCGVGRMTKALSRRFRSVRATDVSPEMVQQGQSLCPELNNVTWEVSDGFDLTTISDGSLDFAFSFLVFQHVPHKEIVLHNVAEMLRVLRPGGGFLFQYNGETRRKVGRRGRLIWGILDRWRIPLLPRLFGIDTREAGKTWDGAPLTGQEVEAWVEARGGQVVGVRGVGTPAAWCWGVKK